ncbi:MAG: YfcE family phosphodiesterase [Solobacterium sp.]|nr:YfcE family phosphodiesterase [Solobacterium sp.]
MIRIPETHIEADPGKPFIIVLCSDSHMDTASLRYVREHHPEADLFVHCGDSELREADMEGFLFVRGNHDFYLGNNVPDWRIIEVLGHRIYLCHGHLDILIYYHYDLMAKHAKANRCDTVFFGHMHICQDFIEDGVRMLNPGSLAYSRDYSGKSYMLVTVTPEKIEAVRMDYMPAGTEHVKQKKKGFLQRLIDKL